MEDKQNKLIELILDDLKIENSITNFSKISSIKSCISFCINKGFIDLYKINIESTDDDYLPPTLYINSVFFNGIAKLSIMEGKNNKSSYTYMNDDGEILIPWCLSKKELKNKLVKKKWL